MWQGGGGGVASGNCLVHSKSSIAHPLLFGMRLMYVRISNRVGWVGIVSAMTRTRAE
jgi:hypothetical protein